MPGLDADVLDISQPSSWGPRYLPNWLPTHLSWLRFLNWGRGCLLCQMGQWGLWNHPLKPAQHPAACGERGGVSSRREASSSGARSLGNTGSISRSRCPQGSPKGPWCPSVSTSCLGNTALQHSQTKSTQPLTSHCYHEQTTPSILSTQTLLNLLFPNVTAYLGFFLHNRPWLASHKKCL